MESYPWRAAYAWDSILAFREPALNIIAYISKLIYNDYATMFFLASLVTVGLNVRIISKYSVDIFVGLMLYIFIGAWPNSMNAVRQYMAAAVIFAGYRYILDRKFLKYCMVIALAVSCHVTAVIMLPAYFVVNRKVSFVNILLILALAAVMYLSSSFFFDVMEEVKGTEQEEYTYMQTSVNVFRVLVAFAPLFLPLLTKNGIFNNPQYRVCFNFLLMNAAFMLGTSGSAYLARVAIYTEIYATLAFPLLLAGMPPALRKLLTVLILLLYCFFCFYELRHRSTMNEFHWIFER